MTCSLTELELLKNAEALLTDAYLWALSTNLESDWAHAKELRARCDALRLKLGLRPLNSC